MFEKIIEWAKSINSWQKLLVFAGVVFTLITAYGYYEFIVYTKSTNYSAIVDYYTNRAEMFEVRDSAKVAEICKDIVNDIDGCNTVEVRVLQPKTLPKDNAVYVAGWGKDSNGREYEPDHHKESIPVHLIGDLFIRIQRGDYIFSLPPDEIVPDLWVDNYVKQYNIKHYVTVPINKRGTRTMIGLLTITSHDKIFDDDDLKRLRDSWSAHCAQAMDS